MTRYICSICKKQLPHFDFCECGGKPAVLCEKIGCGEPATKTVYGLGYLAFVCQKHYQDASQQDRDDAIRFRYAEG